MEQDREGEAGCLSDSRGGEIRRLPKFPSSILSPGSRGKKDVWEPWQDPTITR